jgi:heat-inducible transcriptional repressor
MTASVSPADSELLTAMSAALGEMVDANRQDKIILAGTANLAKSQELRSSISPLLEVIEEQVVLLKLIQEMQAEQHGVALRIGSENPLDEFSASSLVVSSYEKQGAEVAKLGVLGPTRMDYSNNIAAVRAVARYLTDALGGI